MRNIFLEKSYTECGGETSPRPYPEKIKLSILKYIETKLQTTWFHPKPGCDVMNFEVNLT